MVKQLHTKGFSLPELFITIVLAATVILGGLWVWQKTHNTQTKKEANHAQKISADYLIIKEMGIRLKLSSEIRDVYYVIKHHDGFRDTAALYLKSLNSYPGCTPEQQPDGVAAVFSFKPGAANPVDGNLRDAYPVAPLIGDLYYAISNEQYDCSGGKAKNIGDVGSAFRAAIPTIEPIRK